MTFVKQILPMLSAIGLRYSTIIIQFMLVVVISRHTSVSTAGAYFIVFGWINSTCYLAGFGLPDGIVREVSAHLGLGRRAPIYSLMLRSARLFLLLSIATALSGGVVAILFGLSSEMAMLIAMWWITYGGTLYCAQCLLALGWPTLGSFFFYPALNLSLVLTLFPFLLLTQGQPIEHLLIAGLCGTWPTAFVAALCLAFAVRGFRADRAPASEAPVPLRQVMALGIQISMARVAQSALYWIPTWFAGLLLTPAAAAILGLASRLNNSVNAVMAAIRFVVRPGIVAAAARNDWPAIGRIARTINTLTAGGVLLAYLGFFLFGRFLLVGIFGQGYVIAFMPLAILLLGTLCEATGGVVDEVLKMTGNAGFVLGALFCAVTGEVVFSWVGGHAGLLVLAAAQSLVLFALYLAQLLFCWRRRGLLLLPMLYPTGISELLASRRTAQS